MQKTQLLALGLLASVGLLQVRGAIDIGFSVDRVYDASGIPVPVTGLGLLLADTDGDGFGAIAPGNLAIGSLVGSSDLVLYRADFSTADGETPGIWFESAAGLTLSGSWNQGDVLAFVWFPTLTLSSLTATAGDAYGIATFSLWVTPADGSGVAYQLVSSTNNGLFTPSPDYPTLELPDAALRASYAVVPEPAAFLLVTPLAALLAAIASRGRNGPARPALRYN